MNFSLPEGLASGALRLGGKALKASGFTALGAAGIGAYGYGMLSPASAYPKTSDNLFVSAMQVGAATHPLSLFAEATLGIGGAIVGSRLGARSGRAGLGALVGGALGSFGTALAISRTTGSMFAQASPAGSSSLRTPGFLGNPRPMMATGENRVNSFSYFSGMGY